MAVRETAQGLAGLGRNGDSTLVHMQPEEVQGLQALAQVNGTSLTINPETGLPEAFNLGGFFKSLLPTIAGIGVGMIPGMQGLGYGIAAGALTGAALNKKNPLMGAALGGMGGYGGANIASGLGLKSAQAAQATQAGIDPTIAMINTPGATMPSSLTSNAPGFGGLDIGAGQGFGSQGNIINTGIGPQMSQVNAMTPATFGGNLATAGQSARNMITGQEGAFDAFKSNLGGTAGPVSTTKALTTLGMPVAMAGLSGLEPSDLGYGTNLAGADNRDRYDPYASLDLSGDTGLRLYAQGGPVSFADGGAMRGGNRAALAGGNQGAMEGSGLVPLDVSDINTRLGYNPDAQNRSGMGGMGGMMQTNWFMPQVEVPRLGLFADNDQIEAARTAYERQLAAAMAGRGGMGAVPNARRIGMTGSREPMGGGAGPIPMVRYGGTNIASTAKTAPTAETALTRLNLNKNYAMGGTIQSGGLQSLYGDRDDMNPAPQLSQNGYGMGRIQNMASGGMSVYAKGGELREGGFVVPADVVSHLGNGSTDAGLKLLAAKYGAKPIKGNGDGMSDSIPTTIDGKQKARVADGEAFIPPEVVAKHGGTKRFYEMMDRVRKARTGTTKQGRQINSADKLPA
jgi:hypothetical protein